MSPFRFWGKYARLSTEPDNGKIVKSDFAHARGNCEPQFHAVREILEQGISSGEEVGAAVSFYLEGECVVDLRVGSLDEEGRVPWEEDTLVNVWSATKGMVAICVLHLIEQGLIDLEAPVSHYWPEFSHNGKGNTSIKWVLSHKAGLPSIQETLPRGSLFNWATMCNALADAKPWWVPGTKHAYHPMTWGFILGEIVRRVSGLRLGEYFAQNVAQPLEADFYISLPSSEEYRTATIYGAIAGNRPVPEIPDLPGPMGDFLRNMRDPNSMIGASILNPAMDEGLVNTRAWRQAEIPSVNGYGTAHALAKIYSALVQPSTSKNVHLLMRETVERATAEEAYGPDEMTGGFPSRFGLGFMLCHKGVSLSPNSKAFGHPGMGGSLGMADPDVGVGFGCTVNNMSMGLVNSTLAIAAVNAFYQAL